LPVSIAQFIENMKSRFGKSGDIIYRELTLGAIPTVMVYIEGMGDPRLLIEAIHADLPLFIEFPNQSPEVRMNMLKELTITMGKVGEANTFQEVEGKLLSGNTIIFMDGTSTSLYVGTEALKQRGVEEASSQSVVRGPREGFTESLRENTALVRPHVGDSHGSLSDRVNQNENPQIEVNFRMC
jgi:spore germination protein KA